MVLGPEFALVAALAVAVVHRRRSIAGRAAVSLLVGFAVAIAVTALAVLAGRGLGWFGPALLDAERPETGFITAPDKWSVVVRGAGRDPRRGGGHPRPAAGAVAPGARRRAPHRDGRGRPQLTAIVTQAHDPDAGTGQRWRTIP